MCTHLYVLQKYVWVCVHWYDEVGIDFGCIGGENIKYKKPANKENNNSKRILVCKMSCLKFINIFHDTFKSGQFEKCYLYIWYD